MNKTSNNSKPSAPHSKRGHEGLTWFMLFLLVLIIPNLVLAVTEQLTAGGRVAGIVMPLAVYGLIMSLSRKTGRTMILMFPVLFLGAFQMVLTYLYGRGPIAVDMWLNLVTTNSGEVDELLSQLLPAIVWVVVIYVPTIALAATLWAKKRWANGAMVKALRLPALFATAGALLFTALLSGLTPYSPTNDMFPLNAVCNLGMAFGRQTASVEYKETSKDFRFYAKCSFEDKEPETLVLVIGETSRADNWQLYGYSRKTNPLLMQVKGLTVFTNYMSQSNTTHKSVPILLSLAEADNYDILYHTKGIMQAFREAGYHTVFLSNQQRNHSFIDFLGEQADDCLFLRDSHPDNAYDTDLLVPLAQKLARQKGKRTFIVLHTYGSHFSYADRYPDFMREFKNDQYDGAKREYRPQLINAYDNSICQTDLLLRRIIEQLAAQGGSAAMVYTSDHGEDIFDDARHLFLHASPFPSFWQLHVPLVVWTSPAYRERHADIARCLNANRRKRAESNSVFHTLLTMGGVTTSYRNDSLSLASPSFTPHRRLFIDDHNEPRPYSESMQKEDFEAMQRHGINMK
jgi:glucan phosphoethanolaminetransferase (alkaline phosphatase superfamily)